MNHLQSYGFVMESLIEMKFNILVDWRLRARYLRYAVCGKSEG